MPFQTKGNVLLPRHLAARATRILVKISAGQIVCGVRGGSSRVGVVCMHPGGYLVQCSGEQAKKEVAAWCGVQSRVCTNIKGCALGCLVG